MIPLPLFLTGLNWSRYLVYAALIAAAAATIWMHGLFTGKKALYEYQGEQAKQGAAVVVKQGAVTTKVVTEYVKVRGKTEYVTRTIEKEVEVYVESNPTGHCLDPDWGRLHDRAAVNAVPDGGPGAPGEVGTPSAAEALQTVTGNYAACHRTADRLDALQKWVCEQSEVTGTRQPGCSGELR